MQITRCFVLLCFSLVPLAAQNNIKQIDFKNFSYPWTIYSGWPHELQWLDTTEQEQVRLTNGRWLDTEEGGGESPTFVGLTMENLQFADLTGDKRPEAIVTLRYDTGGTQYSHYVYIYTMAARRPKLLAYFHSGDRGYWGLYRVYGNDGKLIVELFDPEKRSGDCCSEAYVRTTYEWRNGRFQRSGAQVSGKPEEPSRLPVTVFGTHN